MTYLWDWSFLIAWKLIWKKQNCFLGSKEVCSPLRRSTDNLIINPVPSVMYLAAALLDESFRFEQHVISVYKSLFASLYRVRNYLSRCSILPIAHTFVSSRLDYCNSIFSFCNSRNFNKRLQRVQIILVSLFFAYRVIRRRLRQFRASDD